MTSSSLVEGGTTITLETDRTLLTLAAKLAEKQRMSAQDAIGEIEQAYTRAAEAEHGPEYLFWAKIGKDGAISVAQVLKIVEVLTDQYREVALSDVRNNFPDAQIGQFVVNAIDPVHPPKVAHWLSPRATDISGLDLSLT
ncbi:hypothetical protein NBRC116589_08360 [Ruegeria sp. HU-ET01832]|uniref:NusA N-terminal domain-containing protein n=1 Tax=Ruegeria sp. HU-ET01832 TaxID=3135906 RepID=UPI0031074F0C